MRTIHRVALVACGVTLSACDQVSRYAPTEPAPGTLTGPRTTASDGAVVQSSRPAAEGHAEIDIPFEGTILLQKYSFTAVRQGDGLIGGRWELQQRFPDRDTAMQGRVVCYTVNGNTAQIGGVIEHSTHPFYQTGWGIIWQVQDNGEGAETDLVSYMATTHSSAPPACAGASAFPMFPNGGGNIQVQQQ